MEYKKRKVTGIILLSIVTFLFPACDFKESDELYPSANYRIWNFETNFEDQNEIDDWTVNTDTLLSSNSKFGNNSLWAVNTKSSVLIQQESFWTIGQSQALGMWVKVPEFPESAANEYKIGGYTEDPFYDTGERLQIAIRYDRVRFYITKYKTTTKLDVLIDITDNIWHYVAFSYDAAANTFYGIVDDAISSVTPAGTTIGSHGARLRLNAANAYSPGITILLDEVIALPDQFIDPDVFVQHYNHNTTWGGTYIP